VHPKPGVVGGVGEGEDGAAVVGARSEAVVAETLLLFPRRDGAENLWVVRAVRLDDPGVPPKSGAVYGLLLLAGVDDGDLEPETSFVPILPARGNWRRRRG
jgi:hypothetical protein